MTVKHKSRTRISQGFEENERNEIFLASVNIVFIESIPGFEAIYLIEVDEMRCGKGAIETERACRKCKP